jgi:hypothetical protein
MRKRYRMLAAFHATMAGFYVAIIGAWHAGRTRLSIALWIAAAVFLAAVGLLVLAKIALLLLPGIRDFDVRRLRHQFQRRRIGRADRPPPGRVTEQLELETPDFGMIAGMSNQPGSHPGFGTADAEAQGLQPLVNRPDGSPLLGESFEGYRSQERSHFRAVPRRQLFAEGQAFRQQHTV